MVFPDIDPADGRLKALRMQPTQMRRLQLCRPAESDVAWMAATLDREGQRFGTGVRQTQNGMLQLQWEGAPTA